MKVMVKRIRHTYGHHYSQVIIIIPSSSSPSPPSLRRGLRRARVSLEEKLLQLVFSHSAGHWPDREDHLRPHHHHQQHQQHQHQSKPKSRHLSLQNKAEMDQRKNHWAFRQCPNVIMNLLGPIYSILNGIGVQHKCTSKLTSSVLYDTEKTFSCVAKRR